MIAGHDGDFLKKELATLVDAYFARDAASLIK